MTLSENGKAPVAPNAVYAAFWRWHFYAGLAILPVLMMMALTGGLYLFKAEISDAIYRPLVFVERSAQTTPAQDWVRAAERAEHGRAIQLAPPAAPDRSARVVVETAGVKRDVYVDPHDARVLGATSAGGIMQTVIGLHSLIIAGLIPNLLIELIAGWAIVMIATGVFLWWPRGQGGGVVTVRSTPAKRLFWRDLHAVTGAFAGLIILFLAVTGMTWSGFWGKEVRDLTNAAGWGKPEPPATAQVSGGEHAEHKAEADTAHALPWALHGTEMSMHHSMDHMMTMARPSIDQMVAKVDAAGMPRPYVLTLPKDPDKAWVASRGLRRAEETRALYLDGATGAVIFDVPYVRYGPVAKAVQWGVATHMGDEYGPINRFVMLAGCIAVWLLGVSAVVMWWKRRPKGRLAAPARPADRRAYAGLLAVVLPLAILYPLVGASLIVALGLDLLIRRLARGRAPSLARP